MAIKESRHGVDLREKARARYPYTLMLKKRQTTVRGIAYIAFVLTTPRNSAPRHPIVVANKSFILNGIPVGKQAAIKKPTAIIAKLRNGCFICDAKEMREKMFSREFLACAWHNQL